VRLVLVADGEEHEITAAARDDACLQDLLAAAGLVDVGVATVDGRAVPSDHRLGEAGVRDGSRVVVGRVPLDDPVPGGPALVAVAGARADAATDPVPVGGGLLVGRAADVDLRVGDTTVSRHHCRVVPDGTGGVVVTPLSTTNATSVDGRRVGAPVRVGPGSLLGIGTVVLRVVAGAGDVDRVRASPTRWDRPPRPGPLPGAPAVALPALPDGPGERPSIGLAAWLLPLALGAAVVLLTGQLRYALFALLGPVAMLATHLGQRRRHRRAGRAAGTATTAALARLRDDLAAAVDVERTARWDAAPDLPDLLARARCHAARLWERRATHPDALRLAAGVGDVPWSPSVDATRPDPAVAEVLAAADRLPLVPVVVDLREARAVGLAGDRARTVPLARALLLQAATLVGPADLDVAVLTSPASAPEWRAAAWLPHARSAGDAGIRVVADADGVAAVLSTAPRGRDERALLLVVDDPELLCGRDAPARAVLSRRDAPVHGIVLGGRASDLPAACGVVVTAPADVPGVVVEHPGARTRLADVRPVQLAARAACRAARALARLDDPDLAADGGTLPARVDLLDLLALPRGDGPLCEALGVGWAARAATSVDALDVPLGTGVDGTVTLDLVADGPHALLGGTTGSGKSELLRSLVAGIAARHGPDRATFVLLDYKGGAAFDALADLPHVVGLVTDLDEHLGARALRCLEAELAHRERRLRAARVPDLPAWRRATAGQPVAPLPRLLVVVDELATLRAELPDFTAALVGIAQRGRSLGVHLVLGTQRPSGAVGEDVRANTALRVALRTTDARDSLDVVGVPDAADVPPGLPGRGLLQVGPAAPVPVQTALVSGHRAPDAPAVVVTPLHRAAAPVAAPRSPPAGEGSDAAQPSDLARLVAAARAAHAASGAPAPRRPWPEPLPERLPAARIATPVPTDAARHVPAPFALLDLPDAQVQRPTGWDPASGPLLVHGALGSGTTSTLLAATLALAGAHPPRRLHVHVIDLDRGGLAALAGLPHAGSVVTAGQDERRTRLLRWLVAEHDRRRALSTPGPAELPAQLLVVDQLPALLAELEQAPALELHDAFVRVLAGGAAVGIWVVASAPRPGAVRAALASAAGRRLVHRLSDPTERAVLGVRGDLSDLPPGRAVDAATGEHLQVVDHGDPAAAVAGLATGPVPADVEEPRPHVVGVLPDHVSATQLRGTLDVATRRWDLPVGLRADDLAPALLPLRPGGHALLLGPPGSGRSAALRALADLLVHARVEVVGCGPDAAPWPDGVRVVAPARLRAVLAGEDLADGDLVDGDLADGDLAAGDPVDAGLADGAPSAPSTRVVLLDDADRVADPGVLPGPDGSRVHLVAAAATEAVRADFSSWLRRVARDRTGVLLGGGPDLPGDLLGVRVPRDRPAAPAHGRGLLCVDGAATQVQLASWSAHVHRHGDGSPARRRPAS